MNAIEICGVKKYYNDFTFHELNLSLPQGSIMGLAGENGAGKSTLIKLIMGTVCKDGGSIKVLGVDNEDRAFADVKQDIGVVLDEAYFPESLTAKQIGRVMSLSFRNWDSACYERLLRKLALPDNKIFKEFSRGMKMKLSAAVALSHNPRLLILDEATGGLDPMVREEMIDMFNDFTRDETHSILMSSHIVSDLEKICDYIAFIHEGRLCFCKEKDRLLEEYSLLRLRQSELEALDPNAVTAKRLTSYGADVLVRSEALPAGFNAERATLEDIILLMAKGDSLL